MMGIVQASNCCPASRSTTAPRPDAIIFEPAGSTAHPQIARAAAAAGIGVVLLNRDADYIAELRRVFHVPTFASPRTMKRLAASRTATERGGCPLAEMFSTFKVQARVGRQTVATPDCSKLSPTMRNFVS